MNNSIKYATLLACIFLLMFTFGCGQIRGNIEEKQGLEINSLSTAIGSVGDNENNHDIQRFSYSINLTNNNEEKTYIKEVMLVLPEDFEEKLITKQLSVIINKDIAPNSTIEITGALDFSSKGLNKEDIDKLNPRILSVKVTSEQIINLEK